MTALPPTLAAQAALTSCNSDPMVRLSTGVTVTMSATIRTAMSNIIDVSYTLHVPAGASVVSIAYPDQFGPLKDTATIVADNPSNTYTSTTVVYLNSGVAPVSYTATTSVGVADGSSTAASGSATTPDGVPLQVIY